MMTISIIITTKNSQEQIKACLQSIKKQTFPAKNREIIVVDNNSTDQTKAIVRQFTSQVYNHGPERSAQRNFGISQAKGKYIMYLDADMSISVDLLKNACTKLKKDNLGALYIPEKVKGKGFWVKVRDFERSFYTGTVIDAVRIVQTDIARQVNGFDESLIGPEDWDFDKKVRAIAKTGILPRSQGHIWHDESGFRPSSYWRKKTYYIKDMDKYINKWGKHKDIKKQFSPWYRMLGVFWQNGKWKHWLSRPHLALGMYVLRLGVGLSYLRSKINV